MGEDVVAKKPSDMAGGEVGERPVRDLGDVDALVLLGLGQFPVVRREDEGLGDEIRVGDLDALGQTGGPAGPEDRDEAVLERGRVGDSLPRQALRREDLDPALETPQGLLARPEHEDIPPGELALGGRLRDDVEVLAPAYYQFRVGETDLPGQLGHCA